MLETALFIFAPGSCLNWLRDGAGKPGNSEENYWQPEGLSTASYKALGCQCSLKFYGRVPRALNSGLRRVEILDHLGSMIRISLGIRQGVA